MMAIAPVDGMSLETNKPAIPVVIENPSLPAPDENSYGAPLASLDVLREILAELKEINENLLILRTTLGG